MFDHEAVLTELDGVVDDRRKTQPKLSRPGPAAGRAPSEMVTLALSGQEARLPSERSVHRHAQRCRAAALPGLPSRERFNR